MAQQLRAENWQASLAARVTLRPRAQALGLFAVAGWQASDTTWRRTSRGCHLQPRKYRQPGKRGLWSPFRCLYFPGDKSNRLPRLTSATQMAHSP